MSSASDPQRPNEASTDAPPAASEDVTASASTTEATEGASQPEAPAANQAPSANERPAVTVPQAAPPKASQGQRLLRVLRRQFRGILTGETPLWLLVALGLGAFLNLVTFAFLISPINRGNLLDPPVEQMEEMGMSATDIADRLSYAEQITPTMLNIGAAIALASMFALVFTLIWRRRLGIYIYIVLTGIMLVSTLLNGMFTPVLLLVPTAVVVTAAINRELLT